MTSRDEPVMRYREQFQRQEYASEYHELTRAGSWRDLLSLRRLTGRVVVFLERAAVRRMIQSVPVSAVTLDGPCGAGKMTAVLSGREKVVGIDASRAMLRQFRLHGGTAAIQADLQALPLYDASVGLVVCTRFMHRMPPSARARVLLELSRVSDGWAIIYYGIKGPFQRAVMAVERLLGLGDRGRSFYCSRELAEKELLTAHWAVVNGTTVAKGVSTGYVFLAKKIEVS